ncbi:MAG: RagB/SusD family nutrient uptake outer membrane protein [Parabacteroides sp.]|nr:RagB/SusD family nutrient uptake outer membrane protein [Parabacteroides sp.]
MNNKILSLFAAAVCLAGCMELDQFPKDKVSSGTFWKTEEHAKQAMMGVYNDMKQENLFGCYFCQDGMSDICFGFYDSKVYGTYTDRDGQVSGKWQRTYDGIMRANAVLHNLPGIDMSDELKARYEGEAKFMRALYYFHLLDFYGGVPLYDETLVLDKDFNDMKLPRSSADETRAFILKDLKRAIETLPVKWDAADYGRATRGAAVALRGKVKLYAQDYPAAIADFEEIVNDPAGLGYGYDLHTSYAELFVPEGHASNEMIFSIQNKGGVGMNYGMPMAWYFGTRSTYGSGWTTCVPTADFVEMYENADGTFFDWKSYFPDFDGSVEWKQKMFRAELTEDFKTVARYPEKVNELRDMYTKRDPRLNYNVILPYTKYNGWNQNKPKECEFVLADGINEANGFIRNEKGWESYLWRKFVPEGDMGGLITNRSHTPINFPLIRYADVLLMLAECYNESDRLDEAVALINRVRQRPTVNMPALNSGPAHLEARTKEAVFERIVRERAFELAGEGHRFSDLRRWKLGVTLLNNRKDYGITGKLQYTHKFAERDYLWPIPGSEIEVNPAIGSNNPGW